ncbi:MAG: hypothetical protein PVF54_02510 [Anaerolineae bacterium]
MQTSLEADRRRLGHWIEMALIGDNENVRTPARAWRRIARRVARQQRRSHVGTVARRRIAQPGQSAVGS